MKKLYSILHQLFWYSVLVLAIIVICYNLYNLQKDYNKFSIVRSNLKKYEGFAGTKITTNPQGYEGFARVKVGANSYKIHEDLENPLQAAETMDQLNTTSLALIDHLQTKYIKKSGKELIKEQYQKIVMDGVAALKNNFKTANMEENIPERSGGDTSYVIDKGDIFAMCLRDPKNGNKIDPKMNDLIFVLIHEMSHLFTSTYGHDSLFWNNFRFLLQEADEVGLYSPINYKKNGSPYCGIVISYSPLYDKGLVDYKKSLKLRDYQTNI